MNQNKTFEFHHHRDLGLYSNLKDLNHSVLENTPVHYRFHNLTENVDSTISRTLDRYLIQLDIIYVRDSVLTTLKETIANSIKANFKRIYFQELKADIHNPTIYKQKISGFKKNYLDNKEKYEELLFKNNFVVLVSFIYNKDMIRIRVMNNVKLSPTEVERINQRIEKARLYNDLAEAFLEAGDETEGAGLGLVMSLMMLKNDGLSATSYKIESQGNNTSVIIDIPLNISKENLQLQKTQDILKNIDGLPTFPKSIQDIQAMIAKPNSSINQIAEVIKKDVALSANILKLANSAAFIRANKVESLDRAIQLIGLKELSQLLYSLGTKQILEGKFPAFLSIWEKSNQCAFYCKLIASKINLPKDTESNLVSAALLHDIGEIILLSLEEKMMNNIGKISASKEIASAVSMEEAALGITHTKVGALIAEKWNFPDLYSKSMEYHHRPLLVEEEMIPYIYPIYLSDMMIKINNEEAKFGEIPEKILQFCKFENSGEFHSFRTKALESFLARAE
ncbi:HDOD domain-containing protein [Leptospira noguchii]|uniref:HDOD domain protein n=3 Tax=Leptospira noguchii TaxID=28182 RepID=M6YBI4_9LEPT|nr:HDOD domain-containing protein [Leptospira noguchii]EKR75554.1 HDOD domain protein [Leptospira noguchii str. 2006001870]EMM99935.1 HDOD domain protein [Leptospira noguchii str. 2007001578]EMO40012.1 HDOD domain protein [Leptospira noguchii serovar Autumnalis str. ZUN142]EMO86999.1 HDOD domain protein [Leptospira noguchii str. 2001034031]EPE86409.1 HDOD domain protein [Leptospira noguchii str. 1993005606]